MPHPIDPATALYAALLARSEDDAPDLAAEVADALSHPEHAAALLGQVGGEGSPVRKSWDESKHPRDHGKFSNKPGAGGGDPVIPQWNGADVTHHGSPSGGFDGPGGREEFIRFGNLPEGGVSTNNIEDTPEEGVSGFSISEDEEGLYFVAGETDMEPLMERYEQGAAYLISGYSFGTGADGEPVFDADTAKATHKITNLQRNGYKWRFDLEPVKR